MPKFITYYASVKNSSESPSKLPIEIMFEVRTTTKLNICFIKIWFTSGSLLPLGRHRKNYFVKRPKSNIFIPL